MTGRALLVIVVALVALFTAATPVSADIITVTSTDDTVANDIVCTLREAIQVANPPSLSANGCVRSVAAGDDSIFFNIAGGGVKTIQVTGAFTVQLTERPASYVFHVRQIAAGQPAQLPFIAHDDCGSWPTFVGGGANAF